MKYYRVCYVEMAGINKGNKIFRPCIRALKIAGIGVRWAWKTERAERSLSRDEISRERKEIRMTSSAVDEYRADNSIQNLRNRFIFFIRPNSIQSFYNIPPIFSLIQIFSF